MTARFNRERRSRAGGNPISHALPRQVMPSKRTQNWIPAFAGTTVVGGVDRAGTLSRQRGISLVWATIVSTLLALAAMVALFSMRQDRNLFAEAWHKVAGGDIAQQAMDAASKATGAARANAVLRKCLIDGKTVVTNVDCKTENKTSKTIEIHDSHGFGPLAPPPAPEKDEPTSNPAVDKMIEKQLR
jgi:hypothetical protein